MNQSSTFPFYNIQINAKVKKKYNRFITMIICRNYTILLIIQLQCYYISSLKQYKNIKFTFYSLQDISIFSLRTRSHFRKDNHWLSSESQKAVISTPDIGYSFSINPPWTWKNSPLHWGVVYIKYIKNYYLYLKGKYKL